MGSAIDRSEPQGRRVASLSPTLLARKGSARPAMRSQMAGIIDSGQSPDDDLGWNDMGAPEAASTVVSFSREARPARAAAAQPRRSARASVPRKGRKAAFTLRLDAERHLKLRLACTLDARSAQALVTDALDRLLAEMPELAALADTVGQRRQS